MPSLVFPPLNFKRKTRSHHIHVNLSVSIKCNLCRQAAAWATVLPLSDNGKALSVSTCCYGSETTQWNNITFIHVNCTMSSPGSYRRFIDSQSALHKVSVPKNKRKHNISWPLWLRCHDFAPPLLCRWKGSTEIALKADLDNSIV